MKIDRVLVVGATASTAATLQALVRHGFNVVGVLGHEPGDTSKISGWYDLKALSTRLGLDYKSFQAINKREHLDWANIRKPDLIFAVGFSQLLSSVWLNLASVACVGFHPTCLPRGRGRAPVAWIILEERQGASTFFVMGEGADDGPILVQHPFAVADTDDAAAIHKKIMSTIESSLNEWLPKLKKGEWNPKEQDETQASWYGVRAPEDGLIDWSQPATKIDLLIKASSPPHPGAYTFFGRKKLVIGSSVVEKSRQIKGVTGRILAVNPDKGVLVQAGDWPIWVSNVSFDGQLELVVGKKLGLNVEDEITRIWNYLDKLNAQ